MTDRVLRWLSAISLILLALVVAWSIGTLPMFLGFRLLAGPFSGAAYVIGYLLLPTTAEAAGDVAGIMLLVVTAQRRQWGWSAAAILCLVIRYYAGLAIDYPAATKWLFRAAGGIAAIRSYLNLFDVLILAPIVVLAFAYAWTRRQPAAAAPAA